MIFYLFQHHGGLLHSFHLVYGLGEEIHAHFQSGCLSPLDIRRKFRIFNQFSLAGSSVTAADNHIGDPGIFHRIPVDIAVPLGDINPLDTISRDQGSIAGKMILCTLNHLFPGHFASIRVKVVHPAFNGLPPAVFCLSFDEKLICRIIVCPDSFLVFPIRQHIKLLSVRVLQ